MFASVLSAWRSAQRPALLGLLLFFCAGAADGALIPFFPLWAHGDAHVPLGLIGLLFACYAGGEILAAPLIGGIADRIGRRPVIVGAAIGVGCGFVALAACHGVLATGIVLLLTGMCESVLHPTIQTAIADVTPAALHRRWFNRVRISNGAGGIVGPAAGALLAALSLRAVFLFAGLMLLAGGVAALLFLRETRPADRSAASGEEADAEEGLSSLLPALRDRRLASLLLWFTLFEVSGNWIESVIPLYAVGAGTLSPSSVGTLFTYAAALAVALQLLFGRAAERRSALLLTAASGGVSILAFVLLAASPASVVLVGAVSLCALGSTLTGSLLPASVNALAPPARRASYMAAASLANDVKDSLGPSLGTALYAIAPRLPWVAAIPLVALATLGLGSALGRSGRPEHREATARGTLRT